ncbi:AAA family ATPase [Aeoliella sp.]|uniref:AAA family ATPase n=1 Tax=Aeoliella sp. TaxID=2795800 RepID=UPI003CCB915C
MNWQQLEALPPSEVVDWAADEPWAQAMRACNQDAEWHAEGDVWTHTKLVCEQVAALDEWPDLSPREQTVLLWTALLHDAAKPLTTTIDPVTGRTTSPKHAVKGEHLARGVLRDLGCPLQLREQIVRMVRFHGRPAFLLERDQPAHEVIRLSWMVSNRLLYLFALADTRGRSTKEMTRPEENLHLWKMVAEENDCFGKPFGFANPKARFVFFRSESPDLFYVPHEAYASTVTMVAGLPGSGKDYWVAAHRADVPMVSLDSLRSELGIDPTDNQGPVVQAARERCRELLRAGTSFVFNATNLLVMTRSRWVDLFADYGARIELVYVEPPLEVILRQNAARSAPVPTHAIHRLLGKLEVPTWRECHELLLLARAE